MLAESDKKLETILKYMVSKIEDVASFSDVMSAK